MENKTISKHQLVRVDVSSDAQQVINGTPDAVHTLDEIKDQTMEVLEGEWSYVPDVNAIYPYQVNVDFGNATVWAVCKIRTFKKAERVAGWYVGVISSDEYGRLLLAANDERDEVMLSFFDFGSEPEAAIKWTAHY